MTRYIKETKLLQIIIKIIVKLDNRCTRSLPFFTPKLYEGLPQTSYVSDTETDRAHSRVDQSASWLTPPAISALKGQ
jgi:hypothetical protein